LISNEFSDPFPADIAFDCPEARMVGRKQSICKLLLVLDHSLLEIGEPQLCSDFGDAYILVLLDVVVNLLEGIEVSIGLLRSAVLILNDRLDLIFELRLFFTTATRHLEY
jgi:hypothetical protein